MTIDSYEELYKRAQRSNIAPTELAAVVAELRKPHPETDPYTLLSILGYAGDASYAPVVEPFLEGPDALSASKALSVLCLYWDLTNRYTQQLLLFMKGVSWDQYEDCRSMAISCAGYHLKAVSSPELLSEIIRIFEDENVSKRLRLSAYESLVEATHGNPRKVPLLISEFDLQTTPDSNVIQQAKERLTSSHLKNRHDEG